MVPVTIVFVCFTRVSMWATTRLVCPSSLNSERVAFFCRGVSGEDGFSLPADADLPAEEGVGDALRPVGVTARGRGDLDPRDAGLFRLNLGISGVDIRTCCAASLKFGTGP